MNSELLSWGRYPHFPQTPHSVSWRSQVGATLETLQRTAGTTLPFGNGRSYGDSCLAESDHVLSMRLLDRFIAADWDRGVVMVEPGMTLGELLALAVPKGWFLRVTPGTRFVTVGGAIANDVHGKNHHRQGTFGCHVSRFGLWRSEQGLLNCSAQENPDLYRATIGGLGLTGIIVWAEIHLARINSSRIRFVTERFDSIDEFFALSDELDSTYEFSVAWVDCTAKGSSAGRGVFSAGEFANDGALSASGDRKITVPVTPPFSLINKLSLRLFNAAYWRRHPRKRRSGSAGYEPFLYPLDAILHWNRIYGRKGFQQYQCVLPPDAAESGTKALLQTIANSGNGSFLAVLKRFGDLRSPGLLSFPRPGVTLALDFRNEPRLEGGLFPRLDSIVRDAGGRLYPAKDAHIGAADFRDSYPEWRELERLRDPAVNSRFWKRVTQ